MSLREQLDDDLKAALRAREATRLSVIRGIKAAMMAAETRGQRTTLDDQGIMQVIAKEMKDRRDALPEFERGGRPDLADKLREEMDILAHYLPEPLSADEIASLIEETIGAVGATGPKDMGKVMAALGAKTRGRADGRLVADMVKARLSGL